MLFAALAQRCGGSASPRRGRWGESPGVQRVGVGCRYGWPARDYPLVAWGWIVGLALIPSLGGYALFTLGLRDLPASQVCVISTWEVVTAALFGWALYGEHLTPIQLLGAACVCTGIAWIQRAEK